MNMRGGLILPDAISIAAEQWASIWPTSILPHRCCAADCRLSIRAITSSTVSLSYRFFIATPKYVLNGGNHSICPERTRGVQFGFEQFPRLPVAQSVSPRSGHPVSSLNCSVLGRRSELDRHLLIPSNPSMDARSRNPVIHCMHAERNRDQIPCRESACAQSQVALRRIPPRNASHARDEHSL